MQSTAEIEKRILASILTWGDKALGAIHDLTLVDFTTPAARDVFSMCLRVQGDDIAVDYTTVGEEFVTANNSAAIQLLADLPQPLHVGELAPYARELRQARRFRETMTLARRVVALETVQDRSEALGEAQRLAHQILEAGHADQSVLISFAEVAKTEIELLEAIRRGDKTPERLVTGISDLDRMLYIEPGQMVIIGGDTSSGKSALCGQIAAHQAKHGKPVVFVTSEMSHRQMLVRIVAGLIGRSVADLVNPAIASRQEADEQYRAFADYRIQFQRNFPPRIEDAVTAIRAGVAKGAKVAIIDYAQRLAEHDDENQERAVAKIANEAKNLALELGIVVIAAAQVNRQSVQRPDRRPILADLRGSGRLEQDADCVVFTYRPKRYGKSGNSELIVAKQRNGAIGTVEVLFNEQSCTFAGLEG